MSMSGLLDTEPLLIGEDLFEVAINDDVMSAAEMRQLADRVIDLSAAALRCARLRGDDPGDPPRTFGNAVEAAELVLGIATYLRSVANKLEARP